MYLARKAIKDYTFSDGTFIPKGNYVSTSMAATHKGSAYYDDPFVFDPWRFADLREESGEGTKHQMVNASLQYLPFGVGKHAWCVPFHSSRALNGVLTRDMSRCVLMNAALAGSSPRTS